MFKIKQTIIAAAVALVAAPAASAQSADGQFAVKAYGDFNLTRAYSLRSSGGCVSGSSLSSSDFGVDFGWTFYQVGKVRLSANIGLSLTPGKQRLSLQAAEWCYSAPPEADMDGDPYVRYVQTTPISRTLKTLHVGIPLYVDADFRVHSMVSIYARLGFASLFNAKFTAGALSGTATAYGCYPQYDDLIIDSPALNDFGPTQLTSAMADRVKARTYVPELMAGIGARVNLCSSLWLDLGFDYRYSGNIYACGKLPRPAGEIAAQASPVTYTAASGTRVKSPVSYLTSDRRNALLLSLALLYKF